MTATHQSAAAERIVIVSACTHEAAAPILIEQLDPAHFDDPRLAVCFEAIRDLMQRGEPIRYTSVSDELARSGTLQKLGGSDFFFTLEAESVPPHELPYFCHQVRSAAARRRYASLATDIASLAAGPTDTEEIEATIQTALDQIHETQGQRGVSIDSLFARLFDELDAKAEPQRIQSTGFFDLDELLNGGFKPGDLIVVAGRTSMGKSALANRIALHAMRSGPVHIVSTEIIAMQLLENLLAIDTQIPRWKLTRRRGIDMAQRDAMAKTARLLSKRLSVADPGEPCDIGRIMAQAHRIAAQRGGLSLLVVDYIQNVAGVDYRTGSREQEVAEISKKLKRLAIQLEIPILALAQMNREIERRDKKQPTLADIRDSDAISHDADAVIAIERPEVRLKDQTPEDQKGAAFLHLIKNRLGPLGRIRLHYKAETLTFQIAPIG